MFDANGSFLLAMFEFFIFLAYFMALWWIFGDLFRSVDLGGVAKALWTIGLILLPFLLMLIYLIVRGRGMAERQAGAIRQAQTETDQYIKSVASSSSPADQISSAKALLDSGSITPAEFEELRREGQRMGFGHVEAGPLVRSSYHAAESVPG